MAGRNVRGERIIAVKYAPTTVIFRALLDKLRAGLKLYDNTHSCRPENETLLRDVLFKENK
jgi:hypothetical protein